MATVPDFGREGGIPILEETHVYRFLFILFSTFFFLCQVRNPDITDNKQDRSSARPVLQPAGYDTVHVRRRPAEQEATSRVCCSLSALYYWGLPLLFVLLRGNIVNRTYDIHKKLYI